MNAARNPCIGTAGAVAALAMAAAARADVCNIKVVTDGNPDYSDIGSLIHSATANWKTDREKAGAIFYWNHIARRQTNPMRLHGLALTDPIRQFNDYGYTMCSTIAGANCAIFGAMDRPVKYWDISLHTVMEVGLGDRYAMLDNSLSALYTLCDGKTLAGVEEIGREGACEASGGRVEAGHIARYHCLHATSPNGFLTGADTLRSLADEARCFNPAGLKYRHYFNDWDLGHRYILNLREGEVYERHYRRLDAGSPNAVPQDKNGKYLADPACFIPNPQGAPGGKDPEAVNPRYRIRGNGVRSYVPDLSAAGLPRHAWAMENVRATERGVAPLAAGRPGSVVFRVEGANVITSLGISAGLLRKGEADQATIAVSVNNGLTWTNVYAAAGPGGPVAADVKLIPEVNGAYEVLVRVTLLGRDAPADAALQSIRFEAITQLNSKTQPRLRLGANTVHVGTGAPLQSVVLWPDLRGDAWRPLAAEARNVATRAEHPGYQAVMFAAEPREEASVVFRLDVPGDLAALTYGGRFYIRAPGAQVDLLHSFDDGATWTRTCSLTDTTTPWDIIRYEKATNVPAGVRRALVKYCWQASTAGPGSCGLYAVRMEAGFAPVDASFKPLEVAFAWKEVQEDRTTVARSHVQKVEKTPFVYTINVGGADHPVMESLRVNLAGARPPPPAYGYSDGRDVGGTRFKDRWVTVGKVLSTGRPYTATVPSETNWGAGDPDGKKLTDGVVGSTYNGGASYSYGVIYAPSTRPEITVDLGEVRQCGAFRVHVGGYPFRDALKGEIEDKIEVLTSVDGRSFASAGFIDTDLRWKDLPVNFMWPQEETLMACNAALILERPVEARHVRFAVTPARLLGITEVQVLDRIAFEPFDLRIALPDGKDRSDITACQPRHIPSQEYRRR